MLPKATNKTEIAICPKCDGEGKHLHRAYSVFTDVETEAGEPCNHCRGTGRLRKTTTIEYNYL